MGQHRGQGWSVVHGQTQLTQEHRIAQGTGRKPHPRPTWQVHILLEPCANDDVGVVHTQANQQERQGLRPRSEQGHVRVRPGTRGKGHRWAALAVRGGEQP